VQRRRPHKNHCAVGDAPGKDGISGAHRGSRSPVKQFGGGGAMVLQ
jgi:hypothetical protein